MEVSSNFKQIMKRESFSLFFRFTVTTMFLHLSKIQSSVTVSSTVKKHVFSQVYAITIECHITLHLTCCKKDVEVHSIRNRKCKKIGGVHSHSGQKFSTKYHKHEDRSSRVSG